MILYTQSFIVRVQQKPAKRFTCVKVHTVTLSKILSCYSAFDKKNPAVLTEMPTDVMPTLNTEHARFPVSQKVLVLTRFSKRGREKFRGLGTLRAHLSAHVGAREKKLLEPRD